MVEGAEREREREKEREREREREFGVWREVCVATSVEEEGAHATPEHRRVLARAVTGCDRPAPKAQARAQSSGAAGPAGLAALRRAAARELQQGGRAGAGWKEVVGGRGSASGAKCTDAGAAGYLQSVFAK